MGQQRLYLLINQSNGISARNLQWESLISGSASFLLRGSNFVDNINW